MRGCVTLEETHYLSEPLVFVGYKFWIRHSALSHLQKPKIPVYCSILAPAKDRQNNHILCMFSKSFYSPCNLSVL